MCLFSFSFAARGFDYLCSNQSCQQPHCATCFPLYQLRNPYSLQLRQCGLNICKSAPVLLFRRELGNSMLREFRLKCTVNAMQLVSSVENFRCNIFGVHSNQSLEFNIIRMKGTHNFVPDFLGSEIFGIFSRH